MCAVTVTVLSTLALTMFILCARWQGRRRDDRARRAGLMIDGHPAGELEHAPETGDHDPEGGSRRYVTVAELIERERDATRPVPLTPWRPSPYPRSGRS